MQIKNIFFAFFGLVIMSATANAAVGDTTWVQANNTQLSWYGNYDTTVNFPTSGTTYRRIYMIFTLGKYTCPSGSTYCGDWDYTVQNFLYTPGGDSLELGRLITPYANWSSPRTPWTWTQRYVFDVTDYVAQLQGLATMRIHYSGYSGGFTANIKFAFIEGTPDRNVIDIKRLWHGSYAYGDTSHSDSNNINVHFPARTETAPAGTESAIVKFNVTGHGSDANYCSEFCSRNYKLMLNGSAAITKAIWRDDCGFNDLSPQSGTWIYDRGNWCPGALVRSHHNVLPGITAGSNFNTAIEFDPYISSGGASYTTEGQLIYYGPMNKATDATLEGVIAPNNDENHFRSNPICEQPILHIRNTGSNTINSMEISYGLLDSTMATYTWSGTLASLKDTDIVLPALPQLNSVSGTTGLYTFTARIVTVNGAADEDASNNTMKTQFAAAPKWPSTFKVVMKTNNQAISSSSTTSETNWTIYDMNNNIMAQRVNNGLNMTYTDTVTLGPGCYRLTITDAGCDGLQWWPYAGSAVTAGYLNVRRFPNSNINMNGYNYYGTFNNDFGCGFTQYFYTNWPLSVTQLAEVQPALEVYPNPAQDEINIDLAGINSVNGVLTVIDVTGRTVMQEKCTATNIQLSTSALQNGVYTIQYTDGQNSVQTLKARIIIAK